MRLLLDCITNFDIWSRDSDGWRAGYWSVSCCTQIAALWTSHALRLAFITIRVVLYPIVIITYIRSILVTCSQQDTLMHPVYALPRTLCTLSPPSRNLRSRCAAPAHHAAVCMLLAWLAFTTATPPPPPSMVYPSSPQPQHRALIACFSLAQVDHLLYCRRNAALRCVSSCLQRAWRRWR